jgi:hypothetical protein
MIEIHHIDRKSCIHQDFQICIQGIAKQALIHTGRKISYHPDFETYIQGIAFKYPSALV